ncbi:pyrophosphate--fructose 6-phosphate 1-phosphotransferase subunit beta-like [Dorcoceras hygrometricum]|uniref:Pyrophosphate--fructose 6-phosphate 1-phosphotransferase subunit beta-like n=1 Tax=Dorcoceras hygrometricum TaxID=472368 RepID=A0A2Z7D8K8_9LAMI|nr:pyrophosphate--fructose 6-phosphate 1-phosphotransferase subunit beta-like [Dorcoceras hygrometricum]
MIVDLIGIFELKGPYCMLTMNDWFLQTLSVIPSGTWDDVARLFTMIRWGPWDIHLKHTKSCSANFSPPSFPRRRRCRRNLFRPSRQGDSVREIFVGFLVQIGEGVAILVVDRIRRRSSYSTVEVPIPSCIDRSRASIFKFFRCAPGSESGSVAAPTRETSRFKEPAFCVIPARRAAGNPDQLAELLVQLHADLVSQLRADQIRPKLSKDNSTIVIRSEQLIAVQEKIS